MEFSGVTKSLYRKALKLAQKIESVSKKESAIKEIKQGFRENAREQDPERIKTMLAKANSKISYLKMVVPHDVLETSQGKNSGTFIFDKSNLIEGKAPLRRKEAIFCHWMGEVDPEDYARHKYLLARQHFAFHDVKPVSPFGQVASWDE